MEIMPFSMQFISGVINFVPTDLYLVRQNIRTRDVCTVTKKTCAGPTPLQFVLAAFP